jgi:hypothetical protein
MAGAGAGATPWSVRDAALCKSVSRRKGHEMVAIYKEITVEADPERVWAAVRDVGAVHMRLAPGFVVDVRLEDDARVVSFRDGRVIRELIVGIDDATRRLAYAAVGVPERTHHNASMQVFASGESASRLVWITDILPDAAAPPIAANMEKGLIVAKRHLEQENPRRYDRR